MKNKESIKNKISRAKIFSITYAKTNILFLGFIIINLFNSTLLRAFTMEKFLNIKPILADLAVILFVGSFGYLFKPKKQFIYFCTWSVIFTACCFINSVYFNNYYSFTSFSLLATAGQGLSVANALTKIFEVKDFAFILVFILFVILYKVLKKKKYFEYVSEIEIGKVRWSSTLMVSIVLFAIFSSTLTGTDLSRLKKQWNREYVVSQFGIHIYQFNDLISSLKPQITSLFGLDNAIKEFVDFYSKNTVSKSVNKYSNIYEDKNIIVIHAESIQNWLLNEKINGKEITPNLNRISKEGLYFSNFYSQESVGTSSDTEFTFNTSLLPAASGTVFVSYWDRNYSYSTPNLLKKKGYYTFSMHGNDCAMWNRIYMHPKLGYDKFYCSSSSYNIDEEIGLGLSDKSFFRQSTEMIKNISETHEKFYGTLIMLTNHVPWSDISEHNDFDVTMPYKNKTTGETEVAPYLEGTTMGDYIKSANYADQAIGEFFDELEEAGLLDNTVIVIYGDHDAKLKKPEYIRYYNYDPYSDSILSEDDPNYKEVDYYSYELNRSVPFIIWTKDNQFETEVTEVMGMYDVQPTLGNMFNFYNPYALGHDIFSTTDNVVVFPNGNWHTNKMYYNNQKDEGLSLIQNDTISSDYITKYIEYAQNRVSISDKIIVYDLFAKNKDLSLDKKIDES
ncbi:MAG: sulfatase-like hydrolase/transferase [Bacilli bacterium]|nr:sulfatase-like hydrolase/transferase [Bacilli bacterium]